MNNADLYATEQTDRVDLKSSLAEIQGSLYTVDKMIDDFKRIAEIEGGDYGDIDVIRICEKWIK